MQEKSLLFWESLKELEFFSVLEQISKRCISEPGKEKINAIFPTEDLEFLRKEHSQIQEMINLIIEEDSFPFDAFSDIRSFLHKSLIQNAVLSSTELLNIKDVIRTFRLLKNFFQRRSEKYPLLCDDSEALHENIILEKHVSDAIDETGEIKDSASKELMRVRREIKEKTGFLRSRIQKILKRVSEEDMLMEEFATVREDRFVIPVKVEHKRHISGVIHGVSQTGSTVFIEPAEIFEMNNEISLLKNEEKREIYRILSALTAEIGDDARLFLTSAEITAHIDTIRARAKYAIDFGGIQPKITDYNELYLKNIKHPMLVHSKGSAKVIPLNIDFNEIQRGHLISGPNAGGKTVALKSVGLNIAMALSGIFPLGECHTNYRDIFTSIGDHQSIENDLSTFSSQIIKLKDIISECTFRSLVLIDELGSGTDPHEGAALAAGILDTFLEMKLFFIATTHQSSLKTYALSRTEIQNASLEFDVNKLIPTYKFLQGIPGNSYAFILAENLGLSKLVLERAKKYVGTQQSEIEESISLLQKYRTEAETLKLQAEAEKLAAEKLKIDFDQKFKEIKQKRQKYIDEARIEASDILNNANSLIERTIKEIREEKRQISEIKHDFEDEKNKIEIQIEDIKKTTTNATQTDLVFKPGDNVKLEETGSIGTVIDVNLENKIAHVDFNGIKFKLSYAQLIKTEIEVKPKYQGNDYFDFGVPTKIDLRGKRAEESIQLVDEFISQALIGNVPQITIIHGKGTGALRHALHEFLKHHLSITTFRLGTLVEGGEGVTIVDL